MGQSLDILLIEWGRWPPSTGVSIVRNAQSPGIYLCIEENKGIADYAVYRPRSNIHLLRRIRKYCSVIKSIA